METTLIARALIIGLAVVTFGFVGLAVAIDDNAGASESVQHGRNYP